MNINVLEHPLLFSLLENNKQSKLEVSLIGEIDCNKPRVFEMLNYVLLLDDIVGIEHADKKELFAKINHDIQNLDNPIFGTIQKRVEQKVVMTFPLEPNQFNILMENLYGRTAIMAAQEKHTLISQQDKICRQTTKTYKV